MYPEPGALADEAIGRLKGRSEAGKAGKAGAYDPVAGDVLKTAVSDFIKNESGKRAELIKKYGPLCLWDVSGITDFESACSDFLSLLQFSSDLFWDTRSATRMVNMFSKRAQFKGYIGTWDVSKVENMASMFSWAGIEDSGIGNWNTRSLSNAVFMFGGAPNLSAGLDLSRWTVREGCSMSLMFWDSSIVDCGIGEWDVSRAETGGMLQDAARFTGHRSLKDPKWPKEKIDAAKVPPELPQAGQRMPAASTAFGALGAAAAARTPEARIARLLADLARSRSGPLSGPPPPQQACAIL